MNNMHICTLEMLNKTEISLIDIAKETEVGYRWLCDFKKGRFTDPGVNKTERLYKYLSEKVKPESTQ